MVEYSVGWGRIRLVSIEVLRRVRASCRAGNLSMCFVMCVWKYSRYSVDPTNCTKRALIFNIKNVHIPFCASFHQSTTL